MDVDVEMVDRGRAENDGIVATEDFDEFSSGRPHVQRQNNCFVVCLAAFTLSMAVFVVGTVYMSPDELPVNEFEFSPESGTVGKDQQNKIEEAFATVQTKNAGINAWMKENGFANTTGNIASHPHKGGSTAGKHHSAIIAGDQTHVVSGHAQTSAPTESAAQTSAPTGSPAGETISADIHAWLDAEVSLSDGVKYEIVDQLTHDNKAFTYVYYTLV